MRPSSLRKQLGLQLPLVCRGPAFAHLRKLPQPPLLPEVPTRYHSLLQYQQLLRKEGYAYQQVPLLLVELVRQNHQIQPL